MADNTIKDLIAVMREERKDTEIISESLSSINVNIQKQVDLTDKLLDSFNSYFSFQKEVIRDIERAKRLAVPDTKDESKPASKDSPGAPKSGASGGDMTILGAIFGTGMTGFLASVAAFGGALAGLRGWEAGAIKKIDTGIRSLGDSAVDGAKGLRNSILVRFFGFVEEGTVVRDAKTGRFAKAPRMTDQIADAIKIFKADALRVFGLGVDGKPITPTGPDGKFAKVGGGAKFIDSVATKIDDLMRPLRLAASGIGSFMSGLGKPLFDFFKSIGGKASGFLGVAGKILKPIGFLFSAFDGVTAYMESDKDGAIARLGDGVGAFLGDFIGAPFDLLKSGVSWILKKFFNVEVDADGNAKAGQGLAGWAVTKLNSFSFEETIGGIVTGLFDVVQGAVDWVGTLFTDPSAALSQLWNGIVGEGGLLDILWMPINLAVDWVTKKFGWREEDAPKFNLLSFLKETIDTVSADLKIKFIQVTDFIKSVPSRVLFAAEEFWENLKADFKIGLLELSDWFANLPAKILASIINILDRAAFTIPDNAATRFFGISNARVGFVDAETVAEANAAANAPNADTSARIAEINKSREDALASIETRRKAAEAARLAQAGGIAQDSARERAIAMQALTVGGDTNTNNTTNHYYTNTGTGASLDPAL